MRKHALIFAVALSCIFAFSSCKAPEKITGSAAVSLGASSSPSSAPSPSPTPLNSELVEGTPYNDCYKDYSDSTFTYEGILMPYHCYAPKSYSPDKKYPVILALHGSGARGSDNSSQVPFFPDLLNSLSLSFYEKDPAIVIIPQCPDNGWWDGIYDTCAMKIVDIVQSKFSTDKNRFYITGCSMGGDGTWDIGIRYTNRVAAMVPVCGVRPGNGVDAEVLKDMPIWIFQGDSDTIVSPETAANWYDELTLAGNKKAKITVFPGVDHNCWPLAWSDPKLYDWLFSQHT